MPRYSHMTLGDYGHKVSKSARDVAMGDWFTSTIRDPLVGLVETQAATAITSSPQAQAAAAQMAQDQLLKQTAASQLSAIQKLQDAYNKNKQWLWGGAAVIGAGMVYLAFFRKRK